MKYRPEIDGLRAVAVVAVVLFHAGIAPLAGGFIGVDVFFVISGYLITRIIAEHLRQGRFSVTDFYSRRLRRILPALLTVAAAYLFVAWWTVPPPSMMVLAETVVWMTAFASNIYFWLNSGYFDPSSQLNPLLHTWTLAVEEQFYIIFPPTLILLWRLGNRWAWMALAVLACASLLVAQWQSSAAPMAAFYLLPARGWELLLGALIALSGDKVRVPPPVLRVMPIAGLAMILFAAFVFNERTPTPSLYTLIPTLGAGMVILGCTEASVGRRILSNSIMVRIGLISYSLYLWHNPIFTFYLE